MSESEPKAEDTMVASLTEADAETDADDADGSGGDEHHDGDDGDGEDHDESSAGLSWPRVAVLGAALAFLGFAAATFLTRDNPPGKGSVDVGFYQDMIAHHDQAIQMASVAINDGADPTVRSFAKDVLIFQEWELGVMDRTLHEWGYSREDRSDPAMEWMGMSVPLDEMPGMASEEDISTLTRASGAEADKLFLELMAEHHLGGLHMAEYAAANADDHDVRELAARMVRNQAIEINEYAMLAERLGMGLDIEKVEVPPGPETH